MRPGDYDVQGRTDCQLEELHHTSIGDLAAEKIHPRFLRDMALISMNVD